MRIHLIKRQTIEHFVAMHARSRTSLRDWLEKIKYADWKSPAEIKQTFKSADLLGNGSNRVVFDIGGNNYRMICKYVFGATQIHLFVCWLGTHAEYDKLCAAGMQYTANDY
ncbi:type II toxin-antitoxin system HigB family toxin [Parapedobacter sp. DT-150]|uniref:type II toxin-antitoxin system HigB family toxin n=1 Tax=Parapedobacter sp. DT-150 TaxID=3396162 RepID=UPI003F1A3CE4